jgi:hypothetical protein
MWRLQLLYNPNLKSIRDTPEFAAMIFETLLDRARDRCSQHRDVNGFFPCCLEHVLAAAMVEDNPDLCMDEAIDVVLEWITGAGRDVHWILVLRESVRRNRSMVQSAGERSRLRANG